MAETHPPKKTGVVKILGSLFLVLAVLGALFFYRDKVAGLLGLGAGEKGQPSWEKKITTLEGEIASKQGGEGAEPPAAGVVTPPPSQEPVAESISPEDEARKLADELLAFFHYLDGQEYFIAYQYKEGSEAHLKAILAALFARPPVVARETDDLTNVMNNIAHFFKVLGKKEIDLAKEVLLQENEDIERVLAMFYRWSEISDQYRGGQLDIRLPLPDLYEYAGFFLNTLGGQAYLFRRDSQVRMLVKYFAIQVVDRADRQHGNRHGIDIRPAIDSLIEEMSATSNLQNRQHYLQTLQELQAAYQTRRE